VHDIWNPWHGCRKVSEGCRNCYMYYLDRRNGKDGADIYRTKAKFDYPLKRTRSGEPVVKSGETIRVCMTSDFFLEEADQWREDAWSIIRRRRDVAFFILTKRIERAAYCLPPDWEDGWENVFLNVSCEDQVAADARIPRLLEIPAKHIGLMCAPLIGPIGLGPYFASGRIEQVICGGENYGGSRICDFDWVKSLRTECESADVRFCFIETGSRFVKDGRLYTFPGKRLQSEMARKSGISFIGKAIEFKFPNVSGQAIDNARLYTPKYREHCVRCGSQMICNGCSDCGNCG